MSRGRTIAKLASTAVLWAALGFSVTMLAAVTLPNLFGYRSTDGSDRQHAADPDARRHGRRQVDPRRPGAARRHRHLQVRRARRQARHPPRALGASAVNGKVNVVTKGDANDTVERWSVPANGRISRVEVDIPKVGYAANWITSPRGKIMFVVIPALLLCIYRAGADLAAGARARGRARQSGDARRHPCLGGSRKLWLGLGVLTLIGPAGRRRDLRRLPRDDLQLRQQLRLGGRLRGADDRAQRRSRRRPATAPARSSRRRLLRLRAGHRRRQSGSVNTVTANVAVAGNVITTGTDRGHDVHQRRPLDGRGPDLQLPLDQDGTCGGASPSLTSNAGLTGGAKTYAAHGDRHHRQHAPARQPVR